MRVFWDTNLFIYLLEPYGDLTAAVVGLAERMVVRGDRLYTSAITLGELLVQAMIRVDAMEVARLKRAVADHATVVPFDEQAADVYARIRAETDLRGPDAFQLACAGSAGAELFVTNDERLSRKVVPGIPILTSLRSVPI